MAPSYEMFWKARTQKVIPEDSIYIATYEGLLGRSGDVECYLINGNELPKEAKDRAYRIFNKVTEVVMYRGGTAREPSGPD